MVARPQRVDRGGDADLLVVGRDDHRDRLGDPRAPREALRVAPPRVPDREDQHQGEAQDHQRAGDEQQDAERVDDVRRHGDRDDHALADPLVALTGDLRRGREACGAGDRVERVALLLQGRDHPRERRRELRRAALAGVDPDDHARAVLADDVLEDVVGAACRPVVRVDVAEHGDEALRGQLLDDGPVRRRRGLRPTPRTAGARGRWCGRWRPRGSAGSAWPPAGSGRARTTVSSSVLNVRMPISEPPAVIALSESGFWMATEPSMKNVAGTRKCWSTPSSSAVRSGCGPPSKVRATVPS